MLKKINHHFLRGQQADREREERERKKYFSIVYGQSTI
jgi:hypothetical protein